MTPSLSSAGKYLKSMKRKTRNLTRNVPACRWHKGCQKVAIKNKNFSARAREEGKYYSYNDKVTNSH